MERDHGHRGDHDLRVRRVHPGRGPGPELLGIGLAFAILIDATPVRLVLVPSLMELMGKANWYLPSRLRWLPDLLVEAGPDTATPASAAEMVPQSASGGSD